MKTHFPLRPWLALLLQAGCWSTAFGLGTVSAQGLPTGIVTTVGDPKISTTSTDTGAVMRIDQTQNLALIQWRSFNIDSGAKVEHYGPSPSALTIHRVLDPETGASQATIRGAMTSDHRVFLVSPGGILVASGAVIDAPSVVLSAHDLSPDLIADGYDKLKAPISSLVFKSTTSSSSYATTSVVDVQSGATLKAGPKGTVLLVGDQISVSGHVVAGAQGQVVLAAVDEAEVDVGDSGFLTIKGFGSGSLPAGRYVSFYGQIDVEGGASPGQVHVVSDDGVYFAGGSSINALKGPVQVRVEADANGDGYGPLQLSGYDASSYYYAKSAAAAPVTASFVNINTLGGDVVFGGGAAGAASGVSLSYANIDTRGTGGAAGAFSVLSRFGSADVERMPAAVSLDHSTVHASSIDIQGFNVESYGVTLSDTTLTASSGLDIRGVSTGRLNSASVGVDIYNGVQLNGGLGHVTVAGRGTYQGVRIQDLVITTSGVAGQQITLAGQSTLSNLPGLGLVTEGALPIRIHDEADAGLASSADLIIGASAGKAAPRALDLGTGALSPQFTVSGRANLRPLGVDEAGRITESIDTPIQVGEGAPGAATSFVVLPQWFNPSVNANLPSVTVIGSSGHAGQIGVAPGALDGIQTLTLQNQGVDSDGIILGGSSATGPKMGILSLLSSGDIGQTGPIHADALNVIAPVTAKVVLNDPGNRVERLSLDGAADSSVSGAAVPAASSTSGIPGFSTTSEAADFETLAITRAPVVEGQTGPLVSPADQVKAFELPQAIEEQRSDVYVRDQFNRPQLCTSASVSATGLIANLDVEPLTLEWAKVRRSPQLSSCSGVRVDSACSAF